MKPIQSLPRLVIVGMVLVAVALSWGALAPSSAFADGSSSDPPMNLPTYDSIPGDGGSAAGDSSVDFTGELEESQLSTDEGLLSELMTLLYLL